MPSCSMAYSNPAISPVLTHCSYKARKSSLEIAAGSGADCVGSSHLEHAESKKILSQERAAQESWGLVGRVERCCWVLPFLASLPSTPTAGEAGGRCAIVAPACTLYLPSTPAEGEVGQWVLG
jgi:hypothetical protein